MSNPAQVESIFFAALELKSAAERADYLVQACGADAALRERVERLLESDPQVYEVQEVLNSGGFGTGRGRLRGVAWATRCPGPPAQIRCLATYVFQSALPAAL